MATMMKTAKGAALGAYVKLCSREGRRILAIDHGGLVRVRPRSDEDHVRGALHWLLRAHDIGIDDGVSAMYSLVEGWMGSYPETTGYIIPTLLDCAGVFEDDTLASRAIEAAEWLRRCQSEDGSFPGSFMERLGPARVFNTGQIIFGFIRAAEHTQGERFTTAAKRAGDWLVRVQDRDGAWRRSTLGGMSHAYNVRTAWALMRLFELTGEQRYGDAALRAADWTLSQQQESGWFANNTFSADAMRSSLHTASYAMRGLLEVGALTGQDRFVAGAERAAVALYEIRRRSGLLPGSFDSAWQGGGQWRCLPGEAQLAIVWLRLAKMCDRDALGYAADELLEDVKSAQLLDETNPDLYGGVSGSVPLDAPYERYCLVSWGAKFLIDALNLKGGGGGTAGG